MKKNLSVFGCTGSIGSTTFNLLKKNNKDFSFYILSGYKNIKKIRYLIKTYNPKFFVVFDDKTYLKKKKEFYQKKVRILNSKDFDNYKFKKSDVSILAIPGMAGLKPSLKVITISKKILIANKESVICGWKLINNLARKNSFGHAKKLR